MFSIEKVYDAYHYLTPSERKVADYLIANSNQLPYMTSQEIKKEAGISEPTLFRFCRKIGYEGLMELKMDMLASEGGQNKNRDRMPEIDTENELQHFVESFLRTEQQVISNTMRFLDLDELRTIAKEINECGQVFFFGEGTSYLVCNDAQRKLRRLGINAVAGWSFSDMRSMVSRTYNYPVLVFVVSHSGITTTSLQVLQTAKMIGYKTLLMTSFPNSPCAEYADVILKTYAPEVPFERSGITSRLSQFTVFDALLSVLVYMRDERMKKNLENMTKLP